MPRIVMTDSVDSYEKRNEKNLDSAMLGVAIAVVGVFLLLFVPGTQPLGILMIVAGVLCFWVVHHFFKPKPSGFQYE